jgi:hypothetical protein
MIYYKNSHFPTLQLTYIFCTFCIFLYVKEGYNFNMKLVSQDGKKCFLGCNGVYLFGSNQVYKECFSIFRIIFKFKKSRYFSTRARRLTSRKTITISFPNNLSIREIQYFQPLTFCHRSFIFNSNKSPTLCNKFSVYYPDVCLQLNMFRAQTQHDCHHDTKVKPEAATAVIELLMMDGKTPKTC